MIEYWNDGILGYWLFINFGKYKEVLLLLTHPVSLS